MKYKVWTCKIVVPVDSVLPDGFDQPPRRAAIDAVAKVADVLACFSGWGGDVTEIEQQVIEGKGKYI